MDSRTREAMNKAVSKGMDAVDAKQTEQIEALESRVVSLEKGIRRLIADVAALKKTVDKDETRPKDK